MLHKPYGSTGRQVSAVGFGGMRFDTSRPMEANAELVRYACSQGVTYFDTAPGYCNDQSEAIMGMAFRDMPGPFTVSTKAMPVFADTAAKAREAVLQSLDRLGVPKIDFYHIWCLRKMEHYALAMRPGGQYEGLLQCKEDGLIGHIVCSSHQPGHEIKTMLDDGKLEGVLLGMNILNFPYRWEGVETAYARGYGVVAMNPLGGGVIPQHEEQFRFLAEEGETPTEAALRFIISCPQVSVALVGFSNTAEVDTACRIADRARPFTDADLARVRAHLSANMNAVCTACGYCKDCPRDIPIPAYMQFYNQKQMFNVPDEEMINRLGGDLGWGMLAARHAAASDCIQCRQCEEACTQHLPIIDRLAELSAWETELEKKQGKG